MIFLENNKRRKTMLRWEKENDIFRGYLKDYHMFNIFDEIDDQGENKYMLTSAIFRKDYYSSPKNAKRGAERRLSRFLELAGLEIDYSWLT
jgi:hypothetical protein